MSIGISILIFFVSIIALVAEIILYFIFGIGASFSGDFHTLTGLAYFFVGLMVLTGATGLSAPICAIIGVIFKSKTLSSKLFPIFLIIVSLLYFVGVPLLINADISGEKVTKNEGANTVIATSKPAPIVPVQQKTQATTQPEQTEQGYIRNFLKLQNDKVSSGYGEFDTPGYSKPKKGLFGKVKNTGDKTVSYLKLTVYFLDRNNARIYEKDYSIVNTASIFDSSSPLKPNYVQDFGFTIEEDAPSDWSGEVEVEITKVKFT